MARTLVVLAFLASIAADPAAAPARPQSSAPAYRVIGYYADWTAGRYPLAGIPAGKLTHVNYAFGKIGPDHRLTFNEGPALRTAVSGDCNGPECPPGLFHQISQLKKAHPHLKFLLSVGGWTDSGPFYEMAATPESRQVFARSCVAFLTAYPQFDGIDLDWEHPVIGGLQRGDPRDAGNYVRLLEDVRRAIGPARLLTIAVSASPRGIAALDYGAMVRSLDWVSVMTYDFHSGSQTRVGYNAALYNNNDPVNPGLNVHDAVEALLQKGVPAPQLVVGVPFFGKGWTGVTSPAVWSTAVKTAPAGNHAAIVDRYLTAPGYVRQWDDVAKVPSLYNAETGHWISYDDPESVRIKGEYVAKRRLGGVMFWELSGDRGPLLDALRAGLGY